MEREIDLQFIYCISFGYKERNQLEDHRDSFVFKCSLDFIILKNGGKMEKEKLGAIPHHSRIQKEGVLLKHMACSDLTAELGRTTALRQNRTVNDFITQQTDRGINLLVKCLSLFVSRFTKREY